MKTTRYITALGLAMLALTACNKDDDAPEGGLEPGQVDIRTSIVSTPTVETRATLNPTDGSGTFDDDDKIILVVYGSNPNPVGFEYSKNVPRTWEEIKTFTGAVDTYTFCGWYNTYLNALPIDGTTFNAATASDPDLLLAVPATVAEGETVQLPFRHVMHQLLINLTGNIVDLGVTIEQFNATKVSLLNMNAAAEVDVKTGTVTPGEASEPDGDYGTKTDLYDFIIAPQKVVTGTEWIKIELADMTFIYKMPATLSDGTSLNELESGKRLTLKLALKKSPTGQTDVVLSGSGISAWGAQGTIDGTVVVGGGDTPATSGNIDMTNMTADETKAAIQTALAAGFTELKLTGPITNSGIDGSGSNSPFDSNTQVTKIDLSEATGWPTVSYVGSTSSSDNEKGLPAFAFFDCGKLEEVKLPAEVKAIGAMAFIGCTSLTVINLENVTHIGGQSFEGCKALTVIDMSKVTTIYQAAFRGTGLTALSLPKATSISEGIPDNNIGSGMGSFSVCEQLVSVEAPLLTSTGYKSFSNCSALQTVNLPMLKEIKAYAFSECPLLVITSFDNVTSVGEWAFFKCTALTELTLPKATRIDIFTFMDCENLTTLKLPAAVELGNYFVSGCSSLTRIEITAPGRITYLDGDDLLDKAVFGNFGDTKFNVADCNLVLNKDKEEGGAGTPPASGNTWIQYDWKSISY